MAGGPSVEAAGGQSLDDGGEGQVGEASWRLENSHAPGVEVQVARPCSYEE